MEGSMNNTGVLIIDDNKAFINVTTTLLTINNYRCAVPAAPFTVEGILEKISDGYKILLLDYLFDTTEINGLDLLHKLQEERGTLEDLRVIIITGYLDKKLSSQLKKEPLIDRVMEKPLDENILLAFLNKHHAINLLEKKLDDEKGIYRSVLDNCPTPVAVIDPTYRILYSNKAEKRLINTEKGGDKCYRCTKQTSSKRHIPCKPCAVTKAFESGKGEVIERWGKDTKGSPWLSCQRTVPIKENGDTIAVIKTVEDRTDVLRFYETREDKPHKILQKRIEEILNYTIQAGFQRGRFYEVTKVPEGGIILNLQKAVGDTKRNLKKKSLILSHNENIVIRIKEYEEIIYSKKNRDKLIYKITDWEELPDLSSIVVRGDAKNRLEIPLFIGKKVAALLFFDKRSDHLKQLPEDDPSTEITEMDVNDQAVLFLTCINNLERIWKDRESQYIQNKNRQLLLLAKKLAAIEKEEELYKIFLNNVREYLGDVEGLMTNSKEEQGKLVKKASLGEHTLQWVDKLLIKDCYFPCCITIDSSKRTLFQDFQESDVKKHFNENNISYYIENINNKAMMLEWLNEIGSWVCFPIMVGEEVIGTISFQSRKKLFFTESKVDFIEQALEIAQPVLARIQTVDNMLQMARRTVHNIRTPSQTTRNYIKGVIEWLEGRKDLAEEDKAKSIASDALKQALNQLKRIERLAYMSTLYSKPFDFKARPLEITKTVSEIFNNSVPPEDPPVALHYNFMISNVMVSFDEDSIKEVFELLIDNALKAMSDNRGEKIIKVSIRNPSNDEKQRVHIKMNSHYIVITVTDNGKGVPEKLSERIFEPWYSTTSTSGLGLAIARKILEPQRGSIWLDTTYNKGASFVVALPTYKK